MESRRNKVDLDRMIPLLVPRGNVIYRFIPVVISLNAILEGIACQHISHTIDIVASKVNYISEFYAN